MQAFYLHSRLPINQRHGLCSLVFSFSPLSLLSNLIFLTPRTKLGGVGRKLPDRLGKEDICRTEFKG